MKIVGIDPGKKTGLCYSSDGGRGRTFKFQTMSGDHYLDLWDFLNEFQPHIVCVESFHWRPKFAELISLEYIGVIKTWAQLWGVSKTNVVYRSPSEVKVLMTDTKLKLLGLYKGRTPHERDALRHVLSYLIVDCRDEYWLEQLKAGTAT